MGVRDILVLIVVYGSLPAIPFLPFYGLLVYNWLGYMRPHTMAWALGSTRLSYYVAIALLIGLGLAWLRGREKPIAVRWQTILICALLAWVTLAGHFAIFPQFSEKETKLFTKVVLISLAATSLVRTRSRLRWLLITISFSVGLLGFKYALYGLLRGGVNFNTGPGGFMVDNNGFAAGLCMTIPLLMGVAWTEERAFMRIGATGLAVFSALTVVYTFSRGGLLGLMVVTLLVILRSRRPWIGVGVAVVALILASVGLSEELKSDYLGRAESILNYQDDASAMGRLDAWSVAVGVSQDHPLVGVGPQNFVHVYPMYGDPDQARVTHNAFFQLLAECGIPAAFMWLCLLVMNIWSMRNLRRRTDTGWVEVYAWALQSSLIAYLVVSMFLDKAYFDYFYQVVALVVCLQMIAAEEPSVSRETKRVHGEGSWWQQLPAVESDVR